MKGEALGIAKEFLPANLAAFGYRNMPAAAPSAFYGAYQRLGLTMKQPPLRQHVKAAKPISTEDTKVPAAAAVKPEPKATAAAHRVSMPNLIAPNLKSFDSPQAAYRAGMALRASVGRFVGNRDATAEVFLRERGLEIFNTASTSDPQKGGYAVPDELSAAIITNLGRYGYARKLPTYLPMKSGRISAPIEVSGPTVYYVNELGQITGSDAEWGEVSVEPMKRATLSYISAEEDADSLVRYTDTLVDVTARNHARAEDREFVSADGTSSYGGAVGLISSIQAGGVYQPANGTGKSTWGGLAIGDFTATMARLPEAYADGSESWIASAAFYGGVMLAAVGGALQGFAEDGSPLFLGKQVHLLPSMPTSTAVSQVSCLFGNWRESAVFGDRGLTFAFSTECPEVFSKDLIALRCVNRSGITIHNAGTASAAGAFVALKTAAS